MQQFTSEEEDERGYENGRKSFKSVIEKIDEFKQHEFAKKDASERYFKGNTLPS